MLSCLKVRCHSSYAIYLCMRIELTLERMSTLLLRPFPKNGSLSRNLIGLKSFGLFTKISGLLPVKPSRASGIPRTLKEIHWSVITIGILRNGNLKNSSFPTSGIKDCSLFYFALCIVHNSIFFIQWSQNIYQSKVGYTPFSIYWSIYCPSLGICVSVEQDRLN